MRLLMRYALFAMRYRTGSLTDRQGVETVRRWSRAKPFDIKISVTLSNDSEYGFVISSYQGEPYVKQEWYNAAQGSFQVRDGVLERSPHDDGRTGDRTPYGRTDLYMRTHPASMRFRNIGCYNIYPNTLRIPQSPSTVRRLRDDGSNLASILQKMPKLHYQAILAAFQQVVPDINGFRVDRLGGWLSLRFYHADPGGGPDVLRDAVAESDGTLRVLALTTALFGPRSRLDVVAIEEPELAIYPGALAKLWDLIEVASERRDIIVTTHSPDLVSRVPVDALRVVRMENGVTRIGPLAQHQLVTLQEELFSAGDLLRIRGLELDEPSERGDGVRPNE